MPLPSTEALAYYAAPGDMTALDGLSPWLQELPSQVDELSRMLQNVALHVLEAWRYGVQLTPERRREVSIGNAHGLLARILELDCAPLIQPRPPHRRVVVTCHDFAVLLCALLRRQGRPARARAGFAGYLVPGRYIDHWVCESWSPEKGRWVRVDAQLDPIQCAGYRIGFDPLDVPAEAYLSGAAAWQKCREGRLDAALFGFSQWSGWGYVRHVVLRDFFALNKCEGLPWDAIGLPVAEEDKVTAQDRARLDEVARVAEGEDLPRLRSLRQEALLNGRPPDMLPWSLKDVP